MGDFGSWFRSALHTASMDRAEFSHRSGVPQRTVGAWFTGSRVPSSASCDRIADVLLLDRDEVLAAAGHRPMDEPLSADDPRRGIIALVRRVDWTPERTFAMRRALEGYIEFDKKGQGG